MDRRQQAAFWLVSLAFLLIALWLLKSILLPFALGVTIAYFLDPPAGWLEKRGLSRALATTTIILCFFGAGLAVVLLLLPVIVTQMSELLASLPNLASTLIQYLHPILDRAAAVIGTSQPADLHETLSAAMQNMASVALGLLQRVLGGGMAIINIVSLLAITPLASFYLLLQWPQIIATVDDWLPREHAETIRGVAREVHSVLTGFLHGAFIICLALGLFYGIALSLVGLNYGLIIGLIAGLISFIPYVGTIFGLVSSVGLAIVQFWPQWAMVILVLSIFVIGQVTADYVLTPKIMGNKIAVHPLWLIFGLFAGGTLFGFLGMLLSVPATAVIGVLARFFIRQYKQSRIYLGSR